MRSSTSDMTSENPHKNGSASLQSSASSNTTITPNPAYIQRKYEYNSHTIHGITMTCAKLSQSVLHLERIRYSRTITYVRPSAIEVEIANPSNQ